MKVVILAGGLGTRLNEETSVIPKPMVRIGGKPIIWHIMKIYAHYGFNEFIICLGYKGEVIKEYFLNYLHKNSDITINIKNGEEKIEIHNSSYENWKVTLIDTGSKTQTGGRIKKIQRYIGDKTFMVTYGDGLGDINIKELLEFHKNHGKLATITTVKPIARWGNLNINDFDQITSFEEKSGESDVWINGGFMVFEPNVFGYIEGDETHLEKDPLENLAKKDQLMSYKHKKFWKPMDTLREKHELEDLWKSGNAPWKIWS